MVQQPGAVVALAQLPHDRDGPPEVVDGLVVLAKEMVGVAEAVQGGPLPQVADLSAEGESLLAVGEGLLGLAEHGVAPADAVECPRQSSR